MAQFVELTKTSPKLQEPLEQLRIENIPFGQDILDLKETASFINSKVKVMNISDVPVKQKNYENVDIKNEKAELLTELINSQHKDHAINNIVMSSYALEYIKFNPSEEPAFKIYKQKVIEQLELSKNYCELIIQLYDKQEKILRETFEFSMKIISKQNTFSKQLQEKSIQYQKECEENFSEKYKQQMETIKVRIQKINFMRIIICRLLTSGIYDWKEINAKEPSLKEIFKATKSPVTIDSLLNE